MDYEKQKRKARTLKAVVRIGKEGINENLVVGIEKLITKRELVKIRILNNCPADDNQIIRQIVEKTDSHLISHIGNVFTIYRKK